MFYILIKTLKVKGVPGQEFPKALGVQYAENWHGPESPSLCPSPLRLPGC